MTDQVPAGARLVRDPSDLADFFSDTRAAHVYALADLEEPYWSPSRWYQRGDAVAGIVELPGMSWNTLYAVATRDAAATLDLVRDLAPSLDPGTLITAPVGLDAALDGVRELAWCGRHVRYELTDRAATPPLDERVVPLDVAHATQLETLYAIEPGEAAFIPHAVADGGFVGVFEGDELVAAAGTHVVSTRYDCAAIGSVYTRPSHRGRGLGRAVTAGVVHRLAGRIGLIALNVSADNAPARAIYESIGFDPILDYDEAEVV